LSRIAGVSEAGAGRRNPERSRGIWTRAAFRASERGPTCSFAPLSVCAWWSL